MSNKVNETTNKGLSRRGFLKSATVTGASLAASTVFGVPALVRAQPEIVVWLERQFLPDSEAWMEESVRLAAAEGGFNVRVDFANPGDESQSRLLAGLEAGVLPDLNHTLAVSLMHSAGATLDVSDVFEEIGESAGGWVDGAIQKMTVGGTVVAIPLNVEPWILHYRRSIFEAAGFTPPFETMEEYLEALKAVTNPSESIWGFGGQMNQWDHEGNITAVIHAFGGQYFDEEGNIVVNTPETLEALRFYTSMLTEHGVMPPGVVGWDPGGNNASYLSGQVASTNNTGSVIRAMREDDPDMLEDTIAAPWPAGWTENGRKATIIRAFGLVANANTQYPDEVKLIIKKIMSPERYPGNLEAGGSFWFSALNRYADLPFFTEDPWNRQIQQDVVPFARAGEYAFGPNATYNEMGDPIGTMLTRVAVDGVDPQQALDELEVTANELLEKNRSAE